VLKLHVPGGSAAERAAFALAHILLVASFVAGSPAAWREPLAQIWSTHVDTRA